MIIDSKFGTNSDICCIFGEDVLSSRYKELKNSELYFVIKLRISEILEWTILNGIKYFKIGISEGIELLSIELLLKLKKKYKHITIECVIFNSKKKTKLTKSVENLIKSVDKVTTIERDEKMYNIGDYIEYMIKDSRYALLLFGIFGFAYDCIVESAHEKNVCVILCPLI